MVPAQIDPMTRPQKKLENLLAAQHCPHQSRVIPGLNDRPGEAIENPNKTARVSPMFTNVLKKFFTERFEYENKVETNDKAGGTHVHRDTSRR